MFYAFGFERVGVLVGDLYFVDPAPHKGQEGPEHGVRLELRLLQRGELKGSIYSAQPIEAGQPIWRADFLESVQGRPGSFDRTHHHPRFRGWEPGGRTFEEDLSADPILWVGERLGDIDAILAGADVGDLEVSKDERAEIAAAIPEIQGALRRLLDRVHAGELAQAPVGGPVAAARTGWL